MLQSKAKQREHEQFAFLSEVRTATLNLGMTFGAFMIPFNLRKNEM